VAKEHLNQMDVVELNNELNNSQAHIKELGGLFERAHNELTDAQKVRHDAQQAEDKIKNSIKIIKFNTEQTKEKLRTIKHMLKAENIGTP